MKLFVIYIGGSTETSLIELHDMRFVLAESIEKTYESLRETWWGTQKSLHLDAWGELTYADGFTITVEPKSYSSSRNEITEKLYFLNLGGYDSTQFTELHHNVFIVAKDKSEAKLKAKAEIQHWEVPHTDGHFEVEHMISVGDLLNHPEYELRLTKTDIIHPFQFTCKYLPIGNLQPA